MKDYKIKCTDAKVWIKLGKWLRVISKNEMTIAEKGQTECLLKDILKKSKFPSDEEFALVWKEKNMLEMILKNRAEKVIVTLNEETLDENREICFHLRNGFKSFYIEKQENYEVELELNKYWIRSDQTGNFLTKQILKIGCILLLEDCDHSISIYINSMADQNNSIKIEELEKMLLKIQFGIELQDLYKKVKSHFIKPLNTYDLELQIKQNQNGEWIVTDKLNLTRGIPREYMITQNGKTLMINDFQDTWTYKDRAGIWKKQATGKIESIYYWDSEEHIKNIGFPDYVTAKTEIEKFRKNLKKELVQKKD